MPPRSRSVTPFRSARPPRAPCGARARDGRAALIVLLAASLLAQCATPGGTSPDGPPTGGAVAGQDLMPTADRTPVAPGGERHGPLPDAGAASCVEEYGPETLTGRAFAFDGTVEDMEAVALTDPEGAVLGDVMAVTFIVHEWFAGGADPTATITMNPPVATAHVGDEGGPAYSVGTRLLVSGAPRWGGEALADAVAWGCGFTRYHSDADASVWREAFTAG